MGYYTLLRVGNHKMKEVSHIQGVSICINPINVGMIFNFLQMEIPSPPLEKTQKITNFLLEALRVL